MSSPHTATDLDPRRGAAFLLAGCTPAQVTTPEDLTAEQRALGELADAFLVREGWPAMPELESSHDRTRLRQLIGRMGELGLLGIDVPAAYGGSEVGRIAATLVTERMGPAGGLAVTHGAQSGLATPPLVLFGTDAQKARYLPRLASGEWVAAYALTEPGYGSDALHARTTARPAPDGDGYILSGEKQWITNAGMADVFTVFAQLEGAGFTAFLVERTAPGVSVGREYEKMGLWSSSTCPLILEDVRVGPEDILGEPGRGHVVALAVLDVSRLNLGAGGLGGARRLLELSARYAQQRVQFGRPIAQFGLIREKLATMQTRIWALEAVIYRTAGLLENAQANGFAADAAHAGAEYAAECAIAKVVGSEVLGQCADEAVQIHGGYGYMREYEVERAYRDARIQRIFEGTNEINRLTVPDVVLRRALRGTLPLVQAAARVPAEVAATRRPAFFDGPLEAERWRVEAARKALLMVSGLAFERLGPALAQSEEMLGALADMAIHLYTGESALLRAEKIAAAGGSDADNAAVCATLAVDEAIAGLRAPAVRAVAHLEQGDARTLALAGLDRLTAFPPIDAIGLRQLLADRLVGPVAAS